MTSQTEDVRAIERPDQLITPEFAALAEFAGFGEYEAVAVHETGKDMSALIDGIPAAMSGYLAARPEFMRLTGGSDPPVSGPLLKEWLDRTIAGPFDGELADFVREVSHLGGKEVTFPGVQIPLPPRSSWLSPPGCRERSSRRWVRPATSPPSPLPERPG
jgi:hypothetical protein